MLSQPSKAHDMDRLAIEPLAMEDLSEARDDAGSDTAGHVVLCKA